VVLGWLGRADRLARGRSGHRLIVNRGSPLPNLGTAIVLVLLGVLLAPLSLGARVLISAVNMQIHSARLLSLAVKWLVLVFAAAMALDHLHVGGEIRASGFAISLRRNRAGRGARHRARLQEIVSRSWERQAHGKDEPPEDALKHL